MSSFFPVNMGVREGYMFILSLFNTCMDWVLSRVVDKVIVEHLLTILRLQMFLLMM